MTILLVDHYVIWQYCFSTIDVPIISFVDHLMLSTIFICRLKKEQRHTHRHHAHGSRQRRLEAVGTSPGSPFVSTLDHSSTGLISLGLSVETVLTFFSFYLFRFCLK